MMLEKKALAKHKQSHDLHVLLLIKQESVTKSAAQVQAYHEGIEGLQRRLTYTPPEEPVTKATTK